MIAKLKAFYARVKANRLGAVAIRTIGVGVVAFVGAFIKGETDAQLLTPAHYLDLSLWHVTVDASIAAGIGAVLAAVQSILWTLAAGAPQLTKTGRANFAYRVKLLAAHKGDHEASA